MLLSKPIILLDFDGCIHSYTSGWQGMEVCQDPPVPGVFEWMLEALKTFDISIYSARSVDPHGRRAMYEYILRHTSEEFIRLVDFPQHKPRAFITIDDRCICFNGNWGDPNLHPRLIREFKPWYR